MECFTWVRLIKKKSLKFLRDEQKPKAVKRFCTMSIKIMFVMSLKEMKIDRQKNKLSKELSSLVHISSSALLNVQAIQLFTAHFIYFYCATEWNLKDYGSTQILKPSRSICPWNTTCQIKDLFEYVLWKVNRPPYLLLRALASKCFSVRNLWVTSPLKIFAYKISVI